MTATAKTASKPRKPATRKTVTEIVEPEFEPEDLDEPLSEDLDEPDDIEIANLLSELGDDEVMVRIYRQAPNSRKLTLCNAIPIKEFDPMMLAYPPYNGGSFRIHARGKSGALSLNRVLDVEKRTPEVPVQGNNGVTREDIATIIAQTLAPILANQPKPQTRAEMLEEIRIMAEITKGNAPAPAPQQSLQDQLGLVTTLITLSKSLAPAAPIAGDDTGILSTLISKGGDVMAQAMQNAREGVNLKPAALPSPAPAPAAEAEASTLTEEEQENMVMIRVALKAACRAAANGEPALAFADNNYSLIPDDVLDTMMDDPQWFAHLCQVVPDCAKHQGWLEVVKARIAVLYAEDLAGEPESDAGNHTESPKLDNSAEDAQTPGNVNSVSPPAT